MKQRVKRRARRQEEVLAWAAQREGRPFRLRDLLVENKWTTNMAHSALTKLREAKVLVARKSKTFHGLEYTLPVQTDVVKKEEHEHIKEEIPTHLVAYAVGYVSAWLDCYAASHTVPATTLARRVGQSLYAAKGR